MQYASFEQFLTVSRGLQAVTINGYMGSIKRMQKALGENPTHEQLNFYIQNLYSSAYSYAHKINTALALERWTEYKGNPIRFGRQRKPKQTIKDTLTEAEVTRLIFNSESKRDKAMIALLSYSGCRNLELCKLRVSDFDPGRNSVRIIKGKGIKDGLCNISSDCTKILLEYIQEYCLNRDDFLFYTYQKKQMTTSAVRKQVKKAARLAGITKRVYPHLLRHSLACNLLLRGANIVLLKNQLRHSMLETTMTYINSIVFESMSDYQKFSPSYI
jgi:site-specific recombinase XerD